MNQEHIIKAIEKIANPYTEELVDLTDLDIEMEMEPDKVIITMNHLGDDEEKNRMFNRAIIRLLKIDFKIRSVKLTNRVVEKVSGTEAMIHPKTKVIAVISGKGGVGKSQVTVNLARTLAKAGKKVGIIDADIYGYSIPKILGLYGEPEVIDSKIMPLKSIEGIEVVSTQYFIENNENKAIVWRAPMLNKMLKHFFNDLRWSSELDYIFIDMPPGTGDIMLNINSYIEEMSAVVVTTANQDAAHVAVRAGSLAKELNFNLYGVIENMSYYDHNGEHLPIFGSGGGNFVAEELKVPLIGQIQIDHTGEKIKHDYEKIVENMEG